MDGNGQNKANNEGANMLARVMQGRMLQVFKSPEQMEFGTIQDDYSLLTNKFPIPIPKSEYFVCRQITLCGEPQNLKPGDHVLMAWVGADPVVIDIIVPAKEVV